MQMKKIHYFWRIPAGLIATYFLCTLIAYLFYLIRNPYRYSEKSLFFYTEFIAFLIIPRVASLWIGCKIGGKKWGFLVGFIYTIIILGITIASFVLSSLAKLEPMNVEGWIAAIVDVAVPPIVTIFYWAEYRDSEF